MDLTTDPRVELAEARKIRLGGEEFLIPRLMLRQTREIEPRMPAILRIVNRRAEALSGVPRDPATGKLAVGADEALDLMERLALTGDEIDVALKVIHAGLTRAYPNARLDELLDMPITIVEINDALTVIMAQAKVTDQAKEPPKGEAEAAS